MIRVNNVSLSFKLHYHRAGGISTWVDIIKAKWSGKDLNGYKALDDVSFALSEGKVLGVIGSNGAGKSTLLRVLAGIYPPDSGSVEVKGKVSALLALGTGFNHALSGVENIELAGMLSGVPKKELPEMIRVVVDFAEIEDFKDISVQYYSSGMYSRLAFGIVLYLQPEILLIDEIFSVGDFRFQEKANQAMSKMRENAKAQVIVSHDLSLIEKECDLVALMESGKLIAVGDAPSMVDLYKSRKK